MTFRVLALTALVFLTFGCSGSDKPNTGGPVPADNGGNPKNNDASRVSLTSTLAWCGHQLSREGALVELQFTTGGKVLIHYKNPQTGEVLRTIGGTYKMDGDKVIGNINNQELTFEVSFSKDAEGKDQMQLGSEAYYACGK